MAYFVRYFHAWKMFVRLNVIFICNQGQTIASSNLTLVSPIWTLQEGALSIRVTPTPTISSLGTIGFKLNEIQYDELPNHKSSFSSAEFLCRFLFGRSPFRLPPDKTAANFEPLELKTLSELGAEILTGWKATLAQWSIQIWEPHENILDHAGALQVAFNVTDFPRFADENAFCQSFFRAGKG